MNREDIIRMAREAGWNGIYSQPMMKIALQEEDFLRFAQAAYAAGAQAEREACAQIAETAEPYQSADLIRKRGQA